MKQSIVLIISIVCGLLGAVLTRTYLVRLEDRERQREAEFKQRHQEIKVLCCKRDVPGGTKLTKSDLGLITVPASGWREKALTEDDVDVVLNLKLLKKCKRGEVLTWADIEGGNPKVKGLAKNIKTGMRAVSINCTGAAAVSGMVKPNDHVDVIASFSIPKKLGADDRTIVQELVTCTILQNVLVLATGKETANSYGGRGNALNGGTFSTVTLQTTLRDAEMLVFAEQFKGRISLALRSPDEPYSEDEKLPQINFEKILEILNKGNQAEVKKGR